MDPIALCNLLLYGRPETRLRVVQQLVAEGDPGVWSIVIETARCRGPWLLRARCLEAIGLAAGTCDRALAERLLDALFGESTSAHRAQGPEVQLTLRQRHVAQLVALGMSNRQIAHQLGIATGTVGVHVQHLLDRLGVPTRAAVGARVGQRPDLFEPGGDDKPG